jgi:hypothetical protein
VGHLRRDDFATLRDWCRAMRPGSAAAVEVAVTAAPLNFGLFPRAVDKSTQTGIELSTEEYEEEREAP